MINTILIVDDEATQRGILQHVIAEKLGYRAVVVSSGTEALAWIQKFRKPSPDLILLDYELGQNNALDVMQSLRESGIAIPVIVVTAYGDMEKATACIRAGAFDFLAKPINVERLDVSLRNALHTKRLQHHVQRLELHRSGGSSFADMVGISMPFTSCVSHANKAAASDVSVLLEGENGVGKELFARAIHGASARSRFAFVVLDCAALQEQKEQRGMALMPYFYRKLLEANHGTLYLAGVSELKLELQAKLLRALQEGEITPVNASVPVKLDVRVIAGTTRCVSALASQGEFRSDLQHNLSTTHIRIPPLRERREDIHLLIEYFIQKYAASEYKTIKGITPSALGMLVSQQWQGNIRQLENMIFRAVMLSERALLDIDDFESLRRPPRSNVPEMEGAALMEHGKSVTYESPDMLSEVSSLMSLVGPSGHMKRMDQLEVETIRYALHYYKGHMSEVARRLGIGRSTLYRKMHDYNITNSENA